MLKSRGVARVWAVFFEYRCCGKPREEIADSSNWNRIVLNLTISNMAWSEQVIVTKFILE